MTKILDFQARKEKNIEEKRRSFERIVFQNFLGAYAGIDQNGTIYPVTLLDISKDGLLFEVPWNAKFEKKMPRDQELTLRMYFTKSSYIPVIVKIKNAREARGKSGESVLHYGCEFDKSYSSFSALEHFIAFLYKYAEHSALDRGDAKTYFI